jgi:aminocarboxymuconate-semialdehyde decarboxylase
MVIDLQHHYFGDEMIQDLNTMLTEQVGPDARFENFYSQDSELKLEGDRLDRRITQMDDWGVDQAVLSFPAPGLNIENRHLKQQGVYAALARIVNDHIAQARDRYPERLKGFGLVSLHETDKAIDELDRVIHDLELQGIILDSNILGENLTDERFRPFFERANSEHVPLFIHPTVPAATQRMEKFYFTTLLGYPLDTTLTAMDLIFTGYLERYQNIEFILAHLGGTLPYLSGRIEYLYEAGDPVFEEPCIEPLSKPPAEYLGDFWYDTALTFSDAIEFLNEIVGNRMVFGSDAPYADPTTVHEQLQNARLTPAERDAISTTHAEQILLNM